MKEMRRPVLGPKARRYEAATEPRRREKELDSAMRILRKVHLEAIGLDPSALAGEAIERPRRDKGKAVDCLG